MNKEIIFHNIDTVFKYLGLTQKDFSIIVLKREKSYYRINVKSKKIMPDLNSIINICKYCDIKLDDFVNKKLKLEIVFEENKEKGE